MYKLLTTNSNVTGSQLCCTFLCLPVTYGGDPQSSAGRPQGKQENRLWKPFSGGKNQWPFSKDETFFVDHPKFSEKKSVAREKIIFDCFYFATTSTDL